MATITANDFPSAQANHRKNAMAERLADFLWDYGGEFTVDELIERVSGLPADVAPEELIELLEDGCIKLLEHDGWFDWEDIEGQRYYRYSPSSEELGE